MSVNLLSSFTSNSELGDEMASRGKKMVAIDLNTRLPREHVKGISPRGMSGILLGTGLMLVLTNSAARWYLEKHTPNLGYRLIQSKWKMLEDLQRPVDWLVLGDSSGNQGVIPEIFNETLGGTAVNLCTVGDFTALGDVWMLERYLARFGPPRGVVLVHVYDIWWRSATRSILAQAPLSSEELENLVPEATRGLRNKVLLIVDRHVPLYSQNVTLSNLVRFPWRSGPRFALDAHGFMTWIEALPHTVKRDYEQHLTHVRDEPLFQLSRDNRRALARIRALAEQHDFDVYIANGPLFEELYDNGEFGRYFEQVQDTLRAFAASSRRVHQVLRDPITFPVHQMAGVDHVIYPAAKLYTNALVAEIIAHRTSGR